MFPRLFGVLPHTHRPTHHVAAARHRRRARAPRRTRTERKPTLFHLTVLRRDVVVVVKSDEIEQTNSRFFFFFFLDNVCSDVAWSVFFFSFLVQGTFFSLALGPFTNSDTGLKGDGGFQKIHELTTNLRSTCAARGSTVRPRGIQ